MVYSVLPIGNKTLPGRHLAKNSYSTHNNCHSRWAREVQKDYACVNNYRGYIYKYILGGADRARKTGGTFIHRGVQNQEDHVNRIYYVYLYDVSAIAIYTGISTPRMFLLIQYAVQCSCTLYRNKMRVPINIINNKLAFVVVHSTHVCSCARACVQA